MMEPNSTAGENANGNISMINPEILFALSEDDFSEWTFYEDSIYASAFSFKPALIAHSAAATKGLRIKREQAA